MKLNAFLRSVVTLSTSFWLPTAAVATTLLSLTDAPSQSDTAYSLQFIATDSTTTVSISGYQPPSFEYATHIGLSLIGTTRNLLGGYWDFTPATKGTYAASFNDGAAVPGLLFGGLTVGDYDRFSQAIPTQVGEAYVLSFLYSNNPMGGPARDTPNGLLIAEMDGGVPSTMHGYSGSVTIPTVGAPEPSTWALALLGFAGLAMAGHRRSRGTIAPPPFFGRRG